MDSPHVVRRWKQNKTIQTRVNKRSKDDHIRIFNILKSFSLFQFRLVSILAMHVLGRTVLLDLSQYWSMLYVTLRFIMTGDFNYCVVLRWCMWALQYAPVLNLTHLRAWTGVVHWSNDIVLSLCLILSVLCLCWSIAFLLYNQVTWVVGWLVRLCYLESLA